mgnify:CR=1 FL=1
MKIRLDDEWLDAASDYRVASAKAEQANAVLAMAKDKLLSLAGDTETTGGDVSVTTISRKGSIDYKAALASVAPNLDAEPFRKPTISFQQIKIHSGE